MAQPDYRAEQRRALNLAPVQQPDPVEFTDEQVFGDGGLSDDEMTALEAKHATYSSAHRHGRSQLYKQTLPPQFKRELTDAEVFGPDVGLTDEQMAALELQHQAKPLSDDETNAARFLRGAGLGLNLGDEVVGGITGGAEYLRSGFDSKRAAAAYASEQAKAEDLTKRYEAEQPGESLALDLVSGAGAGGAMFKGAQGVVRGLTGAKKLGALGNAAALGLTGMEGAAAYSAGVAPQSAGEKFAAAVDPTALMVGGGLGMVAGPLGNVVARGASRLGRAFLPAESKAARFIAEKLAQSEMTPEQWAARQADAAASGKPVNLADTGPQGARDAAGMAAREPGEGREFAQQALGTRQEGQGARVADDIRQASGSGGQSFTQTHEQIAAQRAEQAKPLYNKAMTAPPLKSPALSEIMNRPSAREAMQRGLKIAQNEGVPLDELIITHPDGSQSFTMKGLHYAQQAMGDMIESAQRTGDNAAARAYTILRNQMLGEVDRMNPAYAQARKVFAGHSANSRALEQGRRATNAHPDQIKSEMAAMSESERDFYRQGFAQRTIEEVEKSPDQANAVKRIFGNQAKRARLKAVLGEDKFAELEQRLGVEAQMFETNQSARLGSQTAERMGASEDFQQFVVGQSPEIAHGMVQSFVTGNIGPLARAAGWPAVMNLLRGVSERTRAHIAKMLLSDNPAQVRKALDMIGKEFKNAKTAQAMRDVATGAAASNKDARTGSGIAAGVAYQQSPLQPF